MSTRTLSSFDYKKWGHVKIDRLVQLGVPRNEVYRLLKKRLKHPSHGGHFGRVDEPNELERMVRVLDTMIAKRERKLNPPPPQPKSDPKSKTSIIKEKKRQYKREVFTNTQLLREIGRRNARNLPFLRRVWIYITSFVRWVG